MRLKCFFLFLTLFSLTLCEEERIISEKEDLVPTVELPNDENNLLKTVYVQEKIKNEFDENFDPLIAMALEEMEKQEEYLIKDERNEDLNDWVEEEMELLSDIEEVPTFETFFFILEKERQFKWNPSETPKRPLRFIVEVYEFENGNIIFPRNPDEEEYVDVFSQAENAPFLTNLGKVYLKKMFTIDLFGDFQTLRFENHYGKKIMIRVRLEFTFIVPEKALDDDNLKPFAVKIRTILSELEMCEKGRERNFQMEYNFKKEEENHEGKYLFFTGIELTLVIATAIAQFYSIKKLFDNRLIV